MTDNPGTLAGLIADLEEQHQPYIPSESENLRDGTPNRGPVFCMFCGTRPDRLVWPCPTIELTRKHKRAQYRIVPFTDQHGERKYGAHLGPAIYRNDYPIFRGTEAECEAWIDRQVNGYE